MNFENSEIKPENNFENIDFDSLNKIKENLEASKMDTESMGQMFEEMKRRDEENREIMKGILD